MSQSRRSRSSSLALRHLIPVALLLLMFLQISGSVAATSLTIDEGLHITSGYSILRTGDYRLIEEHPPLIKFIAAWPLLLVPDLPDPRELPGWGLDVAVTDSLRLVRVTQALIYDYQPLDRLVFAARVPVALLALLLGAVAFRWAADCFGSTGGVLALFLLTFDPNILAHAGVAATDLGAACFILIALFTFYRFMRRLSLRRWALSGVTLGLALGAKLSAMLLIPTQGLLILVYGFSAARTQRSSTRWNPVLVLAGAYAGLVLLAALVLWALYGFTIGPVSELGLSLPAPAHAIPWLRLRDHMRGGHAAFLMGQVSHQGWWYYFPVALVVKTPLPILLSWSAGLAILLLGRRRPWQDDLALLLLPVLYLGFSLRSSLNIGYRHLLPILPPLAIAAARLAEGLPSRVRELTRLRGNGWRGWVAIGLAMWLAVGTLALNPHYLAYFNELAGGPDGGYRYLVDSNTDWGQALKELARYQQEHEIESIFLSMFTFLDPSIYGVRYQPLTPMGGDTPAVFPSRFNPRPGTYVISTTTLQGIPLADPEMFDWFRRREPDARIAHVMFLYIVAEEAEQGQWVAQCFEPVAPLPPAVIEEGFGRQDLRRAYFDCTASWLIPSGGRSTGWYVLHRETIRDDDNFIQSHLKLNSLSFEQTRSGALPPFAVFEVASPPAAPAQPLARPVRVGNLSFLGHTVFNQPGNHSFEVWTFWRVEALVEKPASLMLHLIGPGGAPVIVGDGMGVPVDTWQVGDVIVQRHRLELPPELPVGEYSLYTGAYWLDTLERWPIADEDQAIDNQLSLPPVQLRP